LTNAEKEKKQFLLNKIFSSYDIELTNAEKEKKQFLLNKIFSSYDIELTNAEKEKKQFLLNLKNNQKKTNSEEKQGSLVTYMERESLNL
jgi:hypothetical protein